MLSTLSRHLAAAAASTAASAQAVMTVTPAAASRIKDLMNKKHDESIIGLRVGLAKKGCENMSYTMNYAKEIGKLDEVVESEGVKVVVDSNALMYLIGTEMDYVDNDLASEFVFNNPNQKSSCGCGKSFSV
ncbi:iron-sulfur cluster assembly protein, putative [Perkinsus marinus ATCC 50983]|uniref:Iron-sulfur cluster assembly protein, putative n=1 Tax=Perkinsus marinus (strain ATCC 50983 / TXsc) TaxID=423536 RepID=C5KD33_PERM5|nr:iron-sulfur cluster assembly protein, putative [Perkinsus marinus ATCC 50983]EER17782.1 iron-sulfur cluster assembly protein, putative [Perkinsus marinus ATCC 50983]|eukprot:XP_002785986.1 iron-sulfur cluster assembly protein, putative [Perkinsus marinus ATCC 50983]